MLWGPQFIKGDHLYRNKLFHCDYCDNCIGLMFTVGLKQPSFEIRFLGIEIPHQDLSMNEFNPVIFMPVANYLWEKKGGGERDTRKERREGKRLGGG